MKDNTTEIIVILDRSGSMRDIADDMCGSFNAFIDGQRKLPGECLVSMVQFDDQYEVVYLAKSVKDVEPLNLIPRGTTALLDAIGRTITETGARLASMREADRPSKVMVVIITDGHENSSKEYSVNLGGRERVAKMISHQREVYSWEFLFFGANQNAIEVAATLNIPRGSAVTYEASSRGTRAAGAALSASVGSFRSRGVASDIEASYRSAFDRDDE